MLKKHFYRLGEYQISDYENGRLSWERHFDFGVQRSGNGYLLGGALILGPGSHEENGFLIGEFLDKLNQPPQWEETQVWCLESVLRECREPQPPVWFKGQSKDRIARVKRAGEKRPIATQQNRPKEPPERSFTINWKSFKPSLPRLNWPFRFNWRKLTWPWLLGRIFWLTGLLLLILSGLVFGVVMTFHSLEKMWAWSHGYKRNIIIIRSLLPKGDRFAGPIPN
jgi:hypothetical protein